MRSKVGQIRLPPSQLLRRIITYQLFFDQKANAVCEHYIGSVRRECLDHMLICGEQQLFRIIRAYVDYFNQSRPHQAIGQRLPCGPPPTEPTGQITSIPVRNGLHHEYRRAA